VSLERLPDSLPGGRALAARGSKGGAIVGVDEAGRGPWAGPVVAAAVAVSSKSFPKGLRGVTDSKRLSEAQRELVYEQLVACKQLSWSVSVVSRARIDRTNILLAAHEAMAAAVRGVQCRRVARSASQGGGLEVRSPSAVLVDGNLLPSQLLDLPCQAVVGGDRKCFEIAAASILAKVTRDRMMGKMDRRFPQYGFGAHKGYGTAAHQAALRQHGTCSEHRRSFEPMKGFLETGRWTARADRG
ncbi:unnamed protein product, partial [Polarella glacialis]